MPISNDAIQIVNLCVSFNGKQVLKHLSCSFPSRKMSVVLGRSGSGKTTLLRALNRLNECLPGSETSGTVKIRLGEPFLDVYRNDLPPAELRRQVGMVFQVPNILPVSITKNIVLPLKLVLRLNRNEIEERVKTSLESVHLWSE